MLFELAPYLAELTENTDHHAQVLVLLRQDDQTPSKHLYVCVCRVKPRSTDHTVGCVLSAARRGQTAWSGVLILDYRPHHCGRVSCAAFREGMVLCVASCKQHGEYVRRQRMSAGQRPINTWI